MIEPEKNEEIMKHPLYPLYKLITLELQENASQQREHNFEIPEENDFQAFLEDEAKHRVAIAMGKQLNLQELKLPGPSLKPQILRDSKGKEYEQKWVIFLAETIQGQFDNGNAVQILEKLFTNWRKITEIQMIV